MARDMMRLRREVLNNTPHEEQTSGAVASFETDVPKLKECVVSIEPVQDLNGYDSPWPGGGGKNKLAPAFSAGTTKTVNDVNFLFNSDGTVSVSGTCNGANAWQDVVSYFSLPAGTYTLSGGAANGIYLSLRNNRNTALATSRPEPETFTISETTTVRVRACVLANTVVPSNTVLRPMLELGSTATTYAPYANLCPISGWTEANVWRTGKNLLNNTYPGRENAGVTYTRNNDGSVSLSGIASNTSYYKSNFAYNTTTKDYFTYLNAGTYFLTGGLSSDIRIYLTGWYVRDTTMSVTVEARDKGTGVILTFDEPVYITLQINVANGTNTDGKTIYPQLFYGSSAVPGSYETYQGTTIPVTFTEAGTVYGGTLDVIGGVLRVTHAGVDMGTLGWSKGQAETQALGNYAYFYATPSAQKAGNTNFISSSYRAVDSNRNNLYNGQMGVYDKNSSGYKRFAVRNDAYADSTGTEFATAMSGQTIVYELATPFTVQLTPTQLRAIRGQNNIFATTGDTSVKYWKHGG